MPDDTESPKIIVDEDWKSQVQREKETLAAQQSAAQQPGAAPTQATTASPAASTSAAPPAGEASAGPRPPLPPASLTILITSLVAQASMLLEESLKHSGEQRNQILDEARHVIDLLQVLEDKTKGNRTEDEIKLLGQALHEMRMAFVTVRDHPERFAPPQS